jgi:hypothetical protein
MGRLRAVALAGAASCTLLVYACGFDGVAAGPASGEGGVSAGDGSSTSSGDASVGADANATVDANIDIGTAKSCKEILARDPSTSGKSGAYLLDLYCDMVTDNGGWTLVGRSAPNGNGAFGWSSRAGTVADLTKPYSLNVVAAGLTFSEIMITDRDPTTRAYKVPAAPDFLTAHTNNRFKAGTLTTLFGDCTPTPTISMLKYMGETAITDAFFFRDVDDIGQHRGLAADEWDLAYGNCAQGASLDSKQGSIFVR